MDIGDSMWPALLSALAQEAEQSGGLELPPAIGLLVVLFLVLLNGFFVAAEFALVAVRRSRIEQLVAEGNRPARAVRNALEHLDTYIAATQLGITMASLALGWIGEPALAQIIDPVLAAILPADWVQAGSHAIAFAISFALITTLHIVLGELAPKGIALQRPEATSLVVTVPMTIFLRVFRPFIMALNGVGNLVLRLIGFRPAGEEAHVHTVEELRYLVRSSREAGLLESAEEEIVGRALNLGNITAHSVMVPRNEMASVPLDISRDDLLDIAGHERHVRFPVYEDNQDHVVGMIFITDALAWARAHPGEPFTVRAAMRPPLFVPESIKGDDLLAQMRAARTHTAIVIDEYGGVAGLVTLQDILERIVGEMPELDEDSRPDVELLSDGSARIDGLAPLIDIVERFDIKLEDVEADTVGGYVLETLGHIPTTGEEVDIGSYILRVTRMDGLRVADVLLVPESKLTREDTDPDEE
ncbi:MAG: hemolysin family protein [Chloroflexia bacterium]